MSGVDTMKALLDQIKEHQIKVFTQVIQNNSDCSEEEVREILLELEENGLTISYTGE